MEEKDKKPFCLKDLFDKSKKDDVKYEAATKKVPNTVTSDGQSRAGKFFADVKGQLVSAFSDITPPVISIKGLLDFAMNGITELVKGAASTITDGITNKIDGLVTSVTKGGGNLPSPLTDSQWAMKAKGKQVDVEDGPGLLGRAFNSASRGVSNTFQFISDKIDIGITKLNITEDSGVAAKTIAGVLTLAKDKSAAAAKFSDPEAVRAKGAGYLQKAQIQFLDILGKLPGEAKKQVTDIIDGAESAVLDAADETLSETSAAGEVLQSIADIFSSAGEKIQTYSVAAWNAVVCPSDLDDIKEAGLPVESVAVVANKKTTDSRIDQLTEANEERPETPKSVQKEVREIALAEAKASDTILRGIVNNTPEFDTSLFGRVGSDPGSTILGFTPDTNSVDLELWSTEVIYNAGGSTFSLGATPIRGEISYKIPNDTKNMVKSSYSALNGYMVRCLPNESPEGDARAVMRDPKTGSTISSHDFRWTGDTRNTIAIGRAMNQYLEILDGTLKDNINFVPYLAPTTSTEDSQYIVTDVKSEGYEYSVDVKGNKVVPTGDVASNSVISTTPVKTKEDVLENAEQI